MGKIVVTGGCGYIGSHTIVDLMAHNYDVVSIDNLSRSSSFIYQRIEEVSGKKLTSYKIDLCNRQELYRVFDEIGEVDCIIDFAAYKTVPESVINPLLYYKNNLVSLLHLLEITAEHKIPNFIFSSSCSVYGNVKELPVTENTKTQKAECPYANTKLIGEQIIQDVAKTSASNHILLRYFNPVGAHMSGKLGEIPLQHPENLMPIILEVARGKREQLSVFGTDYDTRDGTCIRDYIHVMDIASAHRLAFEFGATKQANNCEIVNLGSGNGTSVLEMINSFEKATKQTVPYTLKERRNGDVAAVYADNSYAKALFNWQPKYSIDDMAISSWKWSEFLQSVDYV